MRELTEAFAEALERDLQLGRDVIGCGAYLGEPLDALCINA